MMFTRESRQSRPGVSRPLGLEHLEQRTVLSASQIVVVALDAGIFPASGPAQLEPFSGLIASAIQALGQPRTWNPEMLQPTRNFEDASWLVDWRIPQSLDGVSMGQGARRELARDTAGAQLYNPRAMSVSLLLWQPRVMLPESSTNSGLPEGEWSPAGHAADQNSLAFSTELTQAPRAADPTPVKEQLPSAAAVDATFGSQLRDAVRDYWPTVSAIDWSFATWESRAANELNRALGWHDWSTTIEIPFSEDPFGDLGRRDNWSSGTDPETSAFTSDRDDARSRDLLPLEDSSLEFLPDLSASGLVEFDCSPNWRDAWNHKLAGKLPRTPVISREGEVDLAREWCRQVTSSKPEGPASMVDPETRIVEVVYHMESQTVAFSEPTSSDTVDEGGMIESLSEKVSGSNSVEDHIPDKVGELNPTQATLPLEMIEVRMDAEVGLYRTFEMSTTPRASDSLAGEASAEPDTAP
jgi:hypothetical protein